MTVVIRQPQLEQIDDENVQQAFQWVLDFLKAQEFLKGQFRLIDFTFTKNGAVEIPHQLGFQPLDVIQTYRSGAGTITYNFDEFTKTNVKVTIASVTDQLRVRFLVGRI